MAVDPNNGQTDNYEHLLDDYSHFAPPAADEVLQGTVLSITAKDVIIDFGYKSEGIVPIEQFQGPAGEVTVQPGDVVDVMIEHGEQPEGYVLLSHTRAARLRIWDNLEKAYQEQLVISGRVLGRVKGGLAVDVGIKAFMPGSQADPRPVHNLDSLIGQDIPVKIIKLNRRRGNVVVSRKTGGRGRDQRRARAPPSSTSRKARWSPAWSRTSPNTARSSIWAASTACCTSPTCPTAASTHPSEMLHVGDEITVKVLKFDRAKERVSLGIKQLEPDPWETVAERYPVNGRVIGRVVNVTDYGAFVELEPGVEGLIHISEMTWSRRMKHPSKVVKPGDQVEAVVLEVHPKRAPHFARPEAARAEPLDHHRQPLQRRLGGGRPRPQHDRFRRLHRNRRRHRRPGARLRSLLDQARQASLGGPEKGPDRAGGDSEYRFRLAPAVAGHQAAPAGRLGELLPEPPGGRYGPRAGLPPGQFRRFRGAGRGRGRACAISPKCRAIPGRRGSEEPPLAVGQEYDFKIIKMSEAEKKIGLSLRAVADDEEKTRLEDYQRQAAAATTTIEEVMSLKDRNPRIACKLFRFTRYCGFVSD